MMASTLVTTTRRGSVEGQVFKLGEVRFELINAPHADVVEVQRDEACVRSV